MTHPSGRLLPGEDLAAEAKVKPPVLLVHGDQDEMINVSEMSEAETRLRAAGFDVQSHISRGTGHGIAPDGLTLALQSCVGDSPTPSLTTMGKRRPLFACDRRYTTTSRSGGDVQGEEAQ